MNNSENIVQVFNLHSGNDSNIIDSIENINQNVITTSTSSSVSSSSSSSVNFNSFERESDYEIIEHDENSSRSFVSESDSVIYENEDSSDVVSHQNHQEEDDNIDFVINHHRRILNILRSRRPNITNSDVAYDRIVQNSLDSNQVALEEELSSKRNRAISALEIQKSSIIIGEKLFEISKEYSTVSDVICVTSVKTSEDVERVREDAEKTLDNINYLSNYKGLLISSGLIIGFFGLNYLSTTRFFNNIASIISSINISGNSSSGSVGEHQVAETIKRTTTWSFPFFGDVVKTTSEEVIKNISKK